MLLHFRGLHHLPLLLYLVCTTVLAESEPTHRKDHENCYFYEFIKGTNQHSDPANQVIYFINNRWLELENDLARGHGAELSYLNSMARCSYELPDKFWEHNLKGLPHKDRAMYFTKHFISKCFCEWE